MLSAASMPNLGRGMALCAHCASLSNSPKHCGVCKVTIYCNRECQKAHWPTHKLACAPPVTINSTTPLPAKDIIELKQVPHAKIEGRAPDKQHLPSELREFIWHPSKDGVNSNLLILFHGLGDTEKKFGALGTQMGLPQTAVIALRAPLPLPFDMPGFCWYPAFEPDGELIAGVKGERRRIEGLTNIRALLQKLLQSLVQHSGWSLERIFLMGFSAGAIVAVDLALNTARLGGVVGVASSLLPEMPPCTPKSRETPILITHGENDERVPFPLAQSHCTKLRQVGAAVSLKTYATKRHEFISSSQEARDVFEFFSSHLHLRNLGLEANPEIVPVSF